MDKTTNGHDRKRAVLYARVSTKGQAEHGYSLRQQIEALRDHAHNEGYEVLAEVVDDGYTAATMERPGLEQVRDLVAAGRVDVVFAQDADRITREPIHRAMLDSEFNRHDCRLIALDDWGDDSYEGELLKYLRGWKSKGERLEIAKRTRRGRWQRAREGKILPTRYPPYGFRYDKEAATYKVDPVTMTHARRIFQMVGEQGTSLTAVKNAFEDEGIPKPGDGKYWDISMIRHMLEHDVYLTRPYEEVRDLVPPGVKLEPDRSYSIYWYNRKTTRRRHGGIKVTGNDPTEQVAIPIEDPGIPPEWVRAARERVKSGVRWSNAGGRVWELKGFLRCECGKLMMAYPINKKRYYYVCRERRERHRVGTHAPYINAVYAERQVREAIMDLVRRPEVMLERVMEEIERERTRRGNIDQQRAAWHEELQKVELRRDAFIEMRADGDLSKEKFREKLAALDNRKATAERELEVLEAEPTEDLDLIEEYIRELPALIHGPEICVRPYETVDPEENGEEFAFQEITPDLFQERTYEEIEEIRRQKERERSERYRAVYQDLQLNVIAHEDRSLEIVAPLRLKLKERSKNSGRGW